MTGGVIRERGLETYDTTRHKAHIDRDGILSKIYEVFVYRPSHQAAARTRGRGLFPLPALIQTTF